MFAKKIAHLNGFMIKQHLFWVIIQTFLCSYKLVWNHFPKYFIIVNDCGRKDESWAYVFTNKDLLRMAKTEDIHSFVNEQRTNFVNKIVRKNNSSILKRLLFNDDDAKKRGPQTNLLSSVMIATNRTPEQFFKNATGQ